MKTAHDLVMAAKTRTQEVALTDADEAIRDADVLIDVREADEFANGHIPGAVNLELPVGADDPARLPGDPASPVVLADRDGTDAFVTAAKKNPVVTHYFEEGWLRIAKQPAKEPAKQEPKQPAKE